MALRKVLENQIAAQLEMALAAFPTDDCNYSKDALRKVFLSLFEVVFDTTAKWALIEITDPVLKHKITNSLYAENNLSRDTQ